ncbi:MAG TPA: glycosyltransferase [Anaeromyxobacter sp.]
MKVVLFVHSIRSDWNHGNAHFVRGVASELVHRGHEVVAWEPAGAWSAANLAHDHGEAALDTWRCAYPELAGVVRVYDPAALDLAEALDGADVALVHEWNEPALVARLGAERARRPGLRLLFHDTHHRAATRPDEMARFDLSRYDGVLAFGRVIRDLYLARRWARRAFTWHEAADVRRFRPLAATPIADVVFVGNWGDEERTDELRVFLLGPVRDLGLSARVFGVRYPPHARAALAAAGVSYGGWLPNHEAPRALASHRVTVHVPRRPYAEALPGIPTIRPFEALACGTPLVCAPWDDADGLFRRGRDHLVARDGAEMRRHLRAVLDEPALARSLAQEGQATIRARHTCGHRVDELLGILRELG